MSRTLRFAQTLASALALTACTETPAPATERAPTTPTEVPARPELRERVDMAPPISREPIEVEFSTSDGFTIHGTLTPGEASRPAVVLVHQLHSSRAEWAPLTARLQAEPALTVLAIDLRGHGASSTGPSGPIDLEHFDAAQWSALSNDVLGAVAYLRTQPHGVSPQRIGIVGSSIGSTAAILAAATDPTLDTLVTLSPGRAYRGVDAITPAIGLGHRHLLSLAASGEADSVEASNAFVRITTGEELLLDGSDHGVALFTAHPDALERVNQFLRASLAAE
jgi:pimeloyl-ACP methyl ester carboxylesterase